MAVRRVAVGKKIKLHDQEFLLQNPNPPRDRLARLTKMRVYGYPLDSETETLKKTFAYYGKITTLKDLTDRACEVKTGVQELSFVKVDHEIPSYIYAGKHQVRCDYQGQSKTCCKCHQTGHIARDCNAGKVCKACGLPDHQKATCPNVRCYHCQETRHL